jgi:hypothetical protein
MSPALNYRPAYFGLFAAQVLAIACNAFLDIQYGGFTAEVAIWSIALGFSLRTGWMQHGVINEDGQKMMRRCMIFGAILSVVLFVPMWGFPRAGLYMLAALQVSYNCVTTTRKHLHTGLLISLVMVIFAASHYRADWTMLFYLVPYVTAVVFTLVAEQINRKTDDLQQQSIGKQVVGGQMTAIATATIAILGLGLLLYVVTPQVTWVYLMWKWGNPTDLKLGGDKTPAGNGGTHPAQSGGGGSSQSTPDAGKSPMSVTGIGLPTLQEMRQAATRKGMPEWQRSAINEIADAAEWTTMTCKPVIQYFMDLWEALKKWLSENRVKIITVLILLGLLALFYALWQLIREAKTVTWIKTRFDYLSLAILGLYSTNPQIANRYYEAMGRLFALRDIERSSLNNTREYQAQIDLFYRYLQKETGAITLFYEDARYSQRQPSIQQVVQAREIYRKLFNALD